MTRRIGLLGGSFDPVHVAHVEMAQAALRELALDEVQLIPAADPWQRPPLAATAAQRLAMLKLAVAGIHGLSVNPIELQRSGPTYTLDTLRALPSGASYTWIFGTDQLRNFCTWRNWPDIAALVDFAVAARPGSPVSAPPELQQKLAQTGHNLRTLSVAENPVSASDIRRRLACGESVTGFVAPATLAYIQTHGLYQTDDTH